VEGSEYLPLMLKLGAAEFHWHFTQGLQALDSELYVPGTVCLLNGIEASIRITMYQLDDPDIPEPEDLGSTLSNSLLRQAREVGIDVGTLQFPEETDFEEKIETRNDNVKVVSLRHDLAHGNVLEYVNRDLNFFTPECLREVSSQLRVVTENWIDEIAAYRKENLQVT